MKKSFSAFLLLLFISLGASAQLIIGGQASYLSGDNAKQWGGGAQLKYLIADRVAIGVTARSYPKNVQTENAIIGGQSATVSTGNTVTPVAGMLEVYFGKQSALKPYLGTDAGLYFNRNFTVINSDNTDIVKQNHKKTYFAVAPKGGLMIKTGGLFALFGQVQYHVLFGSGDPDNITVPGFDGASWETKPADKFWTFDVGLLLRLRAAGK